MFAPDVTQLIAAAVVSLSVLLAAALLAIDLVPPALERWLDRAAKRPIAAALADTRFARMLALRRVPLQEYVARTEPARLRRAVDACRDCDNASRCEAVLRGYLPAGDYGFCPNRESVTRTLQLRAA